MSKADESVVDTDVSAPGGPNVDLRDVTVSWVESGGTFKLVHDAVGADETDADGRFAVTPFKDQNDSVPELDEPDDRFTLVFDLGGSTADAVSSADTFGDALEAGEIVTLQLTTRSGSTTNARLVVPQTLSGTEIVNL